MSKQLRNENQSHFANNKNIPTNLRMNSSHVASDQEIIDESTSSSGFEFMDNEERPVTSQLWNELNNTLYENLSKIS